MPRRTRIYWSSRKANTHPSTAWLRIKYLFEQQRPSQTLRYPLQEFLDHGVVVYLDDIFIYSENEEEHIELVKKVVAKLAEHQLAVSVTKSVFHVESSEFLEYIVGMDGVTMSERKVESVMNWNAPQ